jgi:hypothetical protein
MKELESTIFFAILLSFTIGLLYSGPAFTALVIGTHTTDTIEINEIFTQDTIINLSLKGRITSLKVSGEFIGNGTGIIKIADLVVIDSRDLNKESGNLLTGFIVQNIDSEEDIELMVENDDVEEIIEEEIENDLFAEQSEELELINESLIITNNTLENNDESNISTIINESLNITETDYINETYEEDYEIIEETTTSEEDYEIIIKFENYCKESCYLSLDKDIVIVIELNDIKLNLSKIIYTYEEEDTYEDELEPIYEIEELDLIINETVDETNITLNQSLNLTDLSLNLSVNLTNISSNISLINATNISINLTNISLINLSNITEIDLISNITQINTTNITYENITEIVYENLTGIEFLINKLEIFELLYYEENYVKLGYNKNILTINAENLSKSEAKIFEVDDERLASLIFFVNNTISTEFAVDADSADVILRCVQFTENNCKKWQETDISFVFFNKTVSFTAYEDGIFSVGKISPKTITKIPTNSVYHNSDCEYCIEKYVCDAEIFCVMQNALRFGTTHTTQFDFDIFNIDKSWYKAEVCAYKSYSTEEVVNYIKYSPESFCSDIKYGNSTSDLISYAIVDSISDPVCIDASEILRYAQEEGYSNMFVNWMGQDLQGSNFPFNCYYGINNNACGDSETDCKPYLKISYR